MVPWHERPAEVMTVEKRDRVLLEQPWMRAKEPAAIPDPPDRESLLALTPEQYARLLRDNLVPREPTGPVRERWEQLWRTVTRSERLAERTSDVLEDFLDATEEALTSGDLDDAQRKRAQKFRRFCGDAWKRLQIDEDLPLGWAGRAAAGFNPPARRVLEQLVDAIADHRRSVRGREVVRPADESLWAILASVGLDPENSRRRR
jgi:hypothetical protein